jgi:DMSO/TMAO reductase YedYZ heme-binding membrane subunit
VERWFAVGQLGHVFEPTTLLWCHLHRLFGGRIWMVAVWVYNAVFLALFDLI